MNTSSSCSPKIITTRLRNMIRAHAWRRHCWWGHTASQISDKGRVLYTCANSRHDGNTWLNHNICLHYLIWQVTTGTRRWLWPHKVFLDRRKSPWNHLGDIGRWLIWSRHLSEPQKHVGKEWDIVILYSGDIGHSLSIPSAGCEPFLGLGRGSARSTEQRLILLGYASHASCDHTV